MLQWIEKVCPQCGGRLFVRDDWQHPPENCTTCRARNVRDVRGLLQYHLRYMAHIEKRRMAQEDRQEVIKDKLLREQIAEILDSSETEESELQRLLRSNDIRKLILRLDKQRQTKERDAKRYKAQKDKPAPLTAVSLVPGGAPGLGKR